MGDTKRGVQLINTPIGVNTRIGFRHATPVHQRRFAFVAGFGYDRHQANCRAFDSLTPARSPFGLPVYVARLPPAPFCELRKLSELTHTVADLIRSPAAARLLPLQARRLA